MAKAATDSDFAIIAEGVGEQKTPASALTKLAAALRLYGYVKAPTLSIVTHPQYGKLSIYEFRGTPFGNLVLTTGGSVWPSLEREQDMPIASGVSARFAVAAEPMDLSDRQTASVARGQAQADRWTERATRYADGVPARRPVAATVIPATTVVAEEEVEAEAPRRRGRPPGPSGARIAAAYTEAADAIGDAFEHGTYELPPRAVPTAVVEEEVIAEPAPRRRGRPPGSGRKAEAAAPAPAAAPVNVHVHAAPAPAPAPAVAPAAAMGGLTPEMLMAAMQNAIAGL